MQVKRIYEAMFLVDTEIATDWEQVEQAIGRLMERASAEVLYCKKWDERRLAYDIKRRRHALYVLTFFKGSPDSIVGLERDVQIAEDQGILRVMVTRQEVLTEEQIAEKVEGEGFVPERPVPPSFGPREGGFRSRDRGPHSRPDGRDDRAPAPAPAPKAEPTQTAEVAVETPPAKPEAIEETKETTE